MGETGLSSALLYSCAQSYGRRMGARRIQGWQELLNGFLYAWKCRWCSDIILRMMSHSWKRPRRIQDMYLTLLVMRLEEVFLVCAIDSSAKTQASYPNSQKVLSQEGGEEVGTNRLAVRGYDSSPPSTGPCIGSSVGFSWHE